MVPTALLAYLLLAWLRPRLALGALLFLIPFGHLVRFSIAGVPFTFPEAAAYVLAIAVLTRGARNFKFLRPRRMRLGSKISNFKSTWVVLPLLWLLIAAVSAACSPNALRAWGIWKAYFVAPVVLFFVIRVLYRDASASDAALNHESRIKNHGIEAVTKTSSIIHNSLFIILAIAAGAAIVAAIAIAQRWWPIGVPYPWSLPGKFRATSVFGYPNAVGLYLAPLVPILVGAALFSFRSLRGARIATKQSHPWQGMRLPARHASLAASLRFGSPPAGSLAMTIVFWGAALFASIAIILAKSTGALVALVVAIPAYVILARRSWPRRRPHAAALVIIGAWLALSLALTAWLPYRHEQPTWGPPIIQKLTFQKWSGSVRLAQYRETWQLLRDHPIRGAGLAGYQQAIAPYHEDARVEIFLYPHNLLLAIWVELGLAGVLVFLAISYHLIRQAFIIHYSLFIIPAMLVILVHGLVDVPYFKNDLAMVFWVIVALAVMGVVRGQAFPDNEKSAV